MRSNFYSAFYFGSIAGAATASIVLSLAIGHPHKPKPPIIVNFQRYAKAKASPKPTLPAVETIYLASPGTPTFAGQERKLGLRPGELRRYIREFERMGSK